MGTRRLVALLQSGLEDDPWEEAEDTSYSDEYQEPVRYGLNLRMTEDQVIRHGPADHAAGEVDEYLMSPPRPMVSLLYREVSFREEGELLPACNQDRHRVISTEDTDRGDRQPEEQLQAMHERGL